ncbi:hypothetical protein VTN96DRAFT_3252 [Rasamsonia emersonii]
MVSVVKPKNHRTRTVTSRLNYAIRLVFSRFTLCLPFLEAGLGWSRPLIGVLLLPLSSRRATSGDET